METLPLSLLNDYLYCTRRAALKVVEGWREANEHTARGDIVHEHADLPGYEVAKGVTLLRALPIWSDGLRLSGKCDIVEFIPLRTSGKSVQPGNIKSLKPVEFKLGKRRQWENDDAQVCAQGLCLEEMFKVEIPYGAIFHAGSKRRREVEFTPELRARTQETIRDLHNLRHTTKLPPAVFKPACEHCSLFEICLPKATCAESKAARLSQALFKTD